MKFKSLIVILLSFVINVSAQNLKSFGDINYKDEVQTVLLHPKGFELDKPISATIRDHFRSSVRGSSCVTQ